jgi:hypothetical protein
MEDTVTIPQRLADCKRGRRFRKNDSLHDDGEMELLGRQGRWKGSGFVRLLLEQPAPAE